MFRLFKLLVKRLYFFQLEVVRKLADSHRVKHLGGKFGFIGGTFGFLFGRFETWVFELFGLLGGDEVDGETLLELVFLGTGFGVLGALDRSLLFGFCDLFRQGLENGFFVLLAFERVGEVVTFVFTLILDIFCIASF